MANKMMEQIKTGVEQAVVDPVSWRVGWKCSNIEAASPEEAARKALRIMRDNNTANTAVVFQCTGPSGDTTVVDLLARAEDG